MKTWIVGQQYWEKKIYQGDNITLKVRYMYQLMNQNLQAFYQNRKNKGHFASFNGSIKIKDGRLK